MKKDRAVSFGGDVLEPKGGAVTNTESRLKADPGLFAGPPFRLGVSGGTAAFYRLQLQADAAEELGSAEYFIGKDLSHALDEVDFYEEVHEKAAGEETPLTPLLNFMMEYRGLYTAVEQDAAPGSKPVDLMVLRNLRDGCRSFRMLDLKIGQKTGAPNWKGKSRVRSLRQNMIDGFTNSTEEGFRLEGFDGEPMTIRSMDPLLGTTAPDTRRRRAFRTMFQQMRCADVLMHFLDLHQAPDDPGKEGLTDSLSPAEVAEMVLREVTSKLASLALACRKAPAPQKWIGSSVALCFDSGVLPSRKRDAAKELKVQVSIFDWGRSELNTSEKHVRLTGAQRADYAKFWGYYIHGIDRLAWEAARAYWHRFGNMFGWREVIITLYDFDSHAGSEPIGQVKIPTLQPASFLTVQLRDMGGDVITHKRPGEAHATPCTLDLSVEYRAYPPTSKLSSSWRITVLRAINLPRLSIKGAPDAFVEIIALSEPPDASFTTSASAVSGDGPQKTWVGSDADLFSFRQVTTVQPGTVDPVWQETVELPVAAQERSLEDVLENVSSHLIEEDIGPMLPRDEVVIQAHARSKVAYARGRVCSSPRAPTPGRKLMGPRVSCIPFGEAWDDDAGFEEWRDRLDIAAVANAAPDMPMHMSSGHLSTGCGVFAGANFGRPRIPRAEALRLVEQVDLRGRVLAVLSVVVSCAAVGAVEFFVWPDLGSSDRCLVLGIMALAQLFFGPIALIFELPPRTVEQVGCECCQDFSIKFFRLHKLGRRGVFYFLQGVVWFACSWIGSMLWLTVAGALLCGVGMYFLAPVCGVMRIRVVRKVQRGTELRSARTVTWSRSEALLTRRDFKEAAVPLRENREVRFHTPSSIFDSPAVSFAAPPDASLGGDEVEMVLQRHDMG
eukprot:CAMPEP_0117583962 /NCGR_PEP_ID=MMETSP0784-20121206/67320_1 /TAXON_ID=39447 /ORGANISM="" /LENGTH=892 /DNA_ID=CAMNT_0005384735 /DNA_START=1 /DNA_END=2679 /DNA_ORIENTATION=-